MTTTSKLTRSLRLSHLIVVFSLISAQGFLAVSGEASPVLDTTGSLDSLTSLSPGLEHRSSDAYFNPAGIAWPASRAHVGIVGISQHLRLTLQPRPADAEVPRDIYRGAPLNSERELTALPSQDVAPRGLDQRAQRQLFMQVGLAQELWARHLYVGMTMLIPLHRFELQAPSFPDERAQYFDNTLSFSRWGAELEGMSAAFALAWRLHKQLGIGVGASLTNRSQASSDVFLSDASYQGLSVISPRVEVKSALSPHASITARHDEGRLGLLGFIGVMGPEEVDVVGTSEVKIWGYPYSQGQNSITQRFSQRYRALPLRVRWGARFNLYDQVMPEAQSTSGARGAQAQRAQGTQGSQTPHRSARWSIVSGGQWTQWSQRSNIDGELSGWVDQWEVSGGLVRESRARGWGVDLRWRPTPVPAQVGRSSYVDPSQIALGLSARWSITESLSWQVTTQAHWLLPRLDEKDTRAIDPVRDAFPASVDELSGEPIASSIGLQTNSPGYPGYESGGIVWSGGLSLTWRAPPSKSSHHTHREE